MSTRYFVDAQGNYLGGFDGSEPPAGSVEVLSPPADGRQKWNGSQWLASPEADAELVLKQQIDAEFTAANLDAWIIQFLAMTPDEARDYVNNNGATLAAVRTNVARLAYAVRVLVKREFNR